MKRLILIATVLMSSAASAQQPATPDPEVMQQMISSMRMDRVQLMDALTEAQARMAVTSGRLGRAEARIKELEAKVPAAVAPEEKKEE